MIIICLSVCDKKLYDNIVGLSVFLSEKKDNFLNNFQTYAVDRTVPDSACTATALFGGVKTNFDVGGVDGGVLLNDCSNSLKPEHRVSSMVDWAQEAGKDTGKRVAPKNTTHF